MITLQNICLQIKFNVHIKIRVINEIKLEIDDGSKEARAATITALAARSPDSLVTSAGDTVWGQRRESRPCKRPRRERWSEDKE